MSEIRHILNAVPLLILILFAIFIFDKSSSGKPIEKDNSVVVDYTNSTTSSALNTGKSLFNVNCASCHSLRKDMVGPALHDLEERGPWKDRKQVYEWIKNPSKFMTNNSYVKTLKGKFGVLMTAFPDLQERDIDAIVDYIKSFQNVTPMSVVIR